MAETLVLSVGGSIIIPPTGFDIEFLKQFRQLILEAVEGGQRFVLIVGGGATCRQYQKALAAVTTTSQTDLDWLGIQTTIFNAHFVRLMFGDRAYPEVTTDPGVEFKLDKPIIVAAGWQPGCSTDKDAVHWAKRLGAKTIFNLSNTDFVYDKDPQKHPDAKRLEKIDWATFRREIVGENWTPGKNAPFDPVASKLAESLKLRVGILRGTNLGAVRLALSGQPFPGTVVE